MRRVIKMTIKPSCSGRLYTIELKTYKDEIIGLSLRQNKTGRIIKECSPYTIGYFCQYNINRSQVSFLESIMKY